MPAIYKNERPLFVISLIISAAFWLVLTAATFGIALIFIALFFIIYLFVQSAFVSHLKGTAVRITPEQFPDLHRRIEACREKLGLRTAPDAYLLHADGIFNALAARFLGRNFIVFYSDIIDALEDHPEAINFYVGHELGHIHRRHLLWRPVLWPAGILPLLGAAYSRAREYTCDLYGLHCCDSRDSAAKGLAALAAGHRRWRGMDLTRYAGQSRDTGGFWMSFHELISDYPWLVKRAARILSPEGAHPIPSRNPFAWLLALFVPRIGIGGNAASLLLFVAIIGILAAIAIPAFQDFTVRAKIAEAMTYAEQATRAVESYYVQHNAMPSRLEDAGVSSSPSSGSIRAVNLDSRNGTVHLVLDFGPVRGKSLFFVPTMDAGRKIVWRCGSDDIPARYLPPRCRSR